MKKIYWIFDSRSRETCTFLNAHRDLRREERKNENKTTYGSDITYNIHLNIVMCWGNIKKMKIFILMNDAVADNKRQHIMPPIKKYIVFYVRISPHRKFIKAQSTHLLAYRIHMNNVKFHFHFLAGKGNFCILRFIIMCYLRRKIVILPKINDGKLISKTHKPNLIQ